jgi:hypothetical protein
MRTFAHFDSEGTIQSLVVVDAPKGINAGLVPETGLHVEEVRGVKVDLDAEGEDFRSIFEGFKVETGSASPRSLVKK